MSADDEREARVASDEELAERVGSGDLKAFEELVRRYERQVFSLGMRFLHRVEDAEDFTQEVFLQAFRRIATFRNTGRFYSWLMRIAYNRGSRDAGRRLDFQMLDAESVADTSNDPHAGALAREARALVANAIRALPRRFAECIGLYYYFDLSYQEIAETTGFPLNTVRSHIRRAKLLLAGELAEYAPGGDQ